MWVETRSGVFVPSAGLCPLPDANGFAVDDDERPRELCVRDFRKESVKRPLGFFDGGLPHSKSNDASVGAKGKRPLIRKTFIERQDHSLPLLGPGKEFFIRPS
jgi:hypothetical protein